jgi:hypothetical protein
MEEFYILKLLLWFVFIYGTSLHPFAKSTTFTVTVTENIVTVTTTVSVTVVQPPVTKTVTVDDKKPSTVTVSVTVFQPSVTTTVTVSTGKSKTVTSVNSQVFIVPMRRFYSS